MLGPLKVVAAPAPLWMKKVEPARRRTAAKEEKENMFLRITVPGTLRPMQRDWGGRRGKEGGG